MARPTSAIESERRRSIVARAIHGRRGFTLVESMIASVLLAVSVVGVSGAILTSYAHDKQSLAQRDSVAAAEALMDELTTLPFTAVASNDVGLMDFSGYTDTSNSNQAASATAKMAQSKGKSQTAPTANTGTKNTNGNSQTSLLGGVLGLVNGLLGGLTGNNSGGSSGGGSSSGGSSGSSSSSSTTTTTLPATTASRVVAVQRQDTLTGLAAPNGDLAVITVDANVNGQVVRVRRLISSTEAGSAAAAVMP